MPSGSSSPPVGPFVGIEPIGNVHSNDAGYRAIAAAVQAAAVPGPSSLARMGAEVALVVAASRRYRSDVA